MALSITAMPNRYEAERTFFYVVKLNRFILACMHTIICSLLTALLSLMILCQFNDLNIFAEDDEIGCEVFILREHPFFECSEDNPDYLHLFQAVMLSISWLADSSVKLSLFRGYIGNNREYFLKENFNVLQSHHGVQIFKYWNRSGMKGFFSFSIFI